MHIKCSCWNACRVYRQIYYCKNVVVVVVAARFACFFCYYIARQYETSTTGSIFVENFIKMHTFYNGKRLRPSNYIPPYLHPLTSESESFIMWICFRIASVYRLWLCV